MATVKGAQPQEEALKKLVGTDKVRGSVPAELQGLMNSGGDAVTRISQLPVLESPQSANGVDLYGSASSLSVADAVLNNPAINPSDKLPYFQMSQALAPQPKMPTMGYIDGVPVQIPSSVFTVPNELYTHEPVRAVKILKAILGETPELESKELYPDTLYKRTKMQALRANKPKVGAWLGPELYMAAKQNDAFDIELDHEKFSNEMDEASDSVINQAVNMLFGRELQHELYRLAKYKHASIRQIIIILTEKILDKYKRINDNALVLYGQSDE